jgi:thiamine-phosphate pyrophosphorylase
MVCLIGDRRQLVDRGETTGAGITALETQIGEAIDAAVDLIQIRERDLDAQELASLVARVMRRAIGSATRVVVNDRADVARAAGADGVHLREGGPSTGRVRALGAGRIVGRSIHETTRAMADGFEDYVLFGTVFPSASKAAGDPVAGLAALGLTVETVRVPVLAVGGIDPVRAEACAACGAAGVAAIGVFLPPGRVPGSLGPAGAVAALRAAIARGAARRSR